jgi:plasmid maintenance system antidote protein VapI
LSTLNIKSLKKKGGKLVKSLNQVAKKYLEVNGIKIKYFADYIGCDKSNCTHWFNGERKITTEQRIKVHEFLSGKYLTTSDEIEKEE